MEKHAESPAVASVPQAVEVPGAAADAVRPAKRRFDETPLRAMSGSDIRALRAREGVSQAVLARLLNVTPGLVNRWESGERQPAGAALKLLLLARRHGLDAVA